MKFLKRLDTLLTEIHYQLKRNANVNEERNKILEEFKNDGTTGFKITADGITLNGSSLTSAINIIDERIEDRPTKNMTQKMIEREIKYQEELKEVQAKYPELLDLIETISTGYADMDKYGILDTTKMFSHQYIVKKVEE